jgi:hypothetical protein
MRRRVCIQKQEKDDSSNKSMVYRNVYFKWCGELSKIVARVTMLLKFLTKKKKPQASSFATVPATVSACTCAVEYGFRKVELSFQFKEVLL